jgi:hypothetical protein
MSFTKDAGLQIIELNDEELTQVTGTGGFGGFDGGFGACGCGGFFGGPFITTFTNFNANTVAFHTQTSFAQSDVNQNAFFSEFN